MSTEHPPSPMNENRVLLAGEISDEPKWCTTQKGHRLLVLRVRTVTAADDGRPRQYWHTVSITDRDIQDALWQARIAIGHVVRVTGKLTYAVIERDGVKTRPAIIQVSGGGDEVTVLRAARKSEDHAA